MNEILQHPFTLKAIDWPFLMFTLLFIVGMVYQQEIKGLIKRGGVSLKWGDRTIDIKEIPDHVDQDFSQIQEEIDRLKEKIEALEGFTKIEAAKKERPNLNKEAGRQRIFQSLKSGEYKWRSVERLAAISGMTEDDTLLTLQNEPDILLSRGKSGRTIARMKT